MLFRDSIAKRFSIGLLVLALPACAGSPGEATGSSREAILSGTTVTAPDSPVLFLRGEEGTCTATLIAPNLVVTARHCVADTPEGMFSCTSDGDLVVTGTGAGEIGADDPSSSLAFYTNARVIAGTTMTGAPDVVGATTISTNSTTSCKDDVAFVVLAQPILGIAPAPIRIDMQTQLGESVSAWGYGLTSQIQDPLALRVRDNALIEGVGPDMPAGGTQLAPLRAIRIGPDDLTCNGDSGGPITATSTGAIIGIASLGAEANMSTPNCTNGGTSDTTGPRLAAYEALALYAFAAAGATPTLELGAPPLPVDAGPEAGPPPEMEAGSTITTKNVPPTTPVAYRATGGSCSAAPLSRDSASPFGLIVVAFGWMSARTLRRRARESRPGRGR